MTPTVIVFIAIGLFALGFVMRQGGVLEGRTPVGRPPAPRPRPAPRLAPRPASRPTAAPGPAKAPPGTRVPATAPPLELLEWDGPADPSLDFTSTGLGLDAAHARIRDRYVAARFPGMFRCAADLFEVERVIRTARLAFEEGKLTCANEMLEMASEQSPRARELHLAQLEIAFLSHDPALFTRLAQAFLALHGRTSEWTDIVRLGQALAPSNALFGARAAVRSHEHYGPWPDMPNWINASWDLTSEVLAADLHRAAVKA